MFTTIKTWVRPRKMLAALTASTVAFGTSMAFALSKTTDDQHSNGPIRHVVVIFQENVSFDHYFGTYPDAQNLPGDPQFTSKPGTPSVNNLLTRGLLKNNYNAHKPFLFHRSQAALCDQDHNYKDEQQAYHAGLLDKFVETLGNGPGKDGPVICSKNDTMGYFDGNTVTALWNYAQNYAMSDNSFNTTFGPSTPGALNLISGQTHGVAATSGDTTGDVMDGTVISDAQPFFDGCDSREAVQMSGQNVGDLLNAKGITWGWFQGGFANCNASHIGSDGKPKKDYIPHHEPFQYYASTQNMQHLPPTSVAMIGHQGDQANHQYDLTDFWNAVNAGNIPSVSFLKAPGYQDGHAGYSNPLLEQQFLVDTINKLQQTPEWKSMAIIIAYDDSDGFYDHVMPPIVQQSNTSFDVLTGTDCGQPKSGEYEGRCGYGPRLPLLIISPYARKNFVDHSVTDQSSILQFIEDNWSLGRIGNQSFDERAGTLKNMFDFKAAPDFTPLVLDPDTGEPVK